MGLQSRVRGFPWIPTDSTVMLTTGETAQEGQRTITMTHLVTNKLHLPSTERETVVFDMEMMFVAWQMYCC